MDFKIIIYNFNTILDFKIIIYNTSLILGGREANIIFILQYFFTILGGGGQFFAFKFTIYNLQSTIYNYGFEGLASPSSPSVAAVLAFFLGGTCP